MIPAIDTGIGLKEERPAPRASEAGSPGFSQALHRASAKEQTARHRTLDEARQPGDLRARERYTQDTGTSAAKRDAREARDARERRVAGSEREHRDPKEARDTAPITQAADRQDDPAGELQEAAEQAGTVGLQPSQPKADGLAEAVQDPALAALALEPSDAALAAVAAVPGFQVANDAAPMEAQIGSAAYRLGAHGEGEAELAAQQGLVLDGSTQDKMLGKGVDDVRRAALQETEPDDLKLQLNKALAQEKDVLKPSDAGLNRTTQGLSHAEQVALQTAKNRNEVLSRIAVGGETANAPAIGTQSAEALRQHLQVQGLLARDARAHAVEATSPNTPPTVVTGAGTAATSVDLTQVFETPDDPAVQQRVLERVAHEARWLINNNRQEVTFRLHPEHLGSLHMKVRHEGGTFRVEMMVDNLSAKHLLESNLQDLRNRLNGDNPGGEFFFNVDVRHGNDQPSLYARAHRMIPAANARSLSIEQAAAPNLAGRVMNHSGLSIYV